MSESTFISIICWIYFEIQNIVFSDFLHYNVHNIIIITIFNIKEIYYTLTTIESVILKNEY